MDLKIFIIAKLYDLFISMIAESSDPFGFDHKIFEILLKEQEYTAKETSFSCYVNLTNSIFFFIVSGHF